MRYARAILTRINDEGVDTYDPFEHIPLAIARRKHVLTVDGHLRKLGTNETVFDSVTRISSSPEYSTVVETGTGDCYVYNHNSGETSMQVSCTEFKANGHVIVFKEPSPEHIRLVYSDMRSNVYHRSSDPCVDYVLGGGGTSETALCLTPGGALRKVGTGSVTLPSGSAFTEICATSDAYGAYDSVADTITVISSAAPAVNSGYYRMECGPGAVVGSVSGSYFVGVAGSIDTSGMASKFSALKSQGYFNHEVYITGETVAVVLKKPLAGGVHRYSVHLVSDLPGLDIAGLEAMMTDVKHVDANDHMIAVQTMDNKLIVIGDTFYDHAPHYFAFDDVVEFRLGYLNFMYSTGDGMWRAGGYNMGTWGAYEFADALDVLVDDYGGEFLVVGDGTLPPSPFPTTRFPSASPTSRPSRSPTPRFKLDLDVEDVDNGGMGVVGASILGVVLGLSFAGCVYYASTFDKNYMSTGK